MTYARNSKIKTSRCRLVFAYEIKTCYLIQRYMAIIQAEKANVSSADLRRAAWTCSLGSALESVSYTQLDVYKRQCMHIVSGSQPDGNRVCQTRGDF